MEDEIRVDPEQNARILAEAVAIMEKAERQCAEPDCEGDGFAYVDTVAGNATGRWGSPGALCLECVLSAVRLMYTSGRQEDPLPFIVQITAKHVRERTFDGRESQEPQD